MIEMKTELENISTEQLINTINDAIIIVDKNLEVIEINNYARAIIGEENSNVYGEKVSEILRLTYIDNKQLDIQETFLNIDGKTETANIPLAKLISKDKGGL